MEPPGRDIRLVVGDARGGCTLNWLELNREGYGDCLEPGPFFWSVQEGDPRRQQGLPGSIQARLGSGDGLWGRPLSSVQTPGADGGRTTPLQAALAC